MYRLGPRFETGPAPDLRSCDPQISPADIA